MSWQMEEEEANKSTQDEDLSPSDWEEKEDSDAWRHQAQKEIDDEINPPTDNEDDPQNERADNFDDDTDKTKKGTSSAARTVSKHYNLQSTEPLSIPARKWILIKSLILWIYLVIISTGAINYKSKSPQLIWFISYIILFIFWCLFFRITASSSRGGFYPLIGDWTQQLYHTTLFIFGLAGVDMYFLEQKKIIMRECVMQYKVVEFSILWFCYFISLSWQKYPWSDYLEEEYINWSTNFDHVLWFEHINTIPILILLMDSVVHYSKVYHFQFWQNISKLQYIAVLVILWIDTLIRGLLLILFVRVSLGYIAFVLCGYVIYLLFIWITALGKSMDAPLQQFKLTFKKSGGKLIQAMLLSMWSVCGLFQILPSIKSASSDIQQQQRKQQNWGKNVIRFECFLRLLFSVILFCKFWVMRNFKFEFEQKIIIYINLIAFALYPYAMELLFQTPLSLLCRGSFFLVHHVDTLTSLPNFYRFNKDIQQTMPWKLGLIVTNIRKLSNLNHKYGRKCGDLTIIKFMQRIVFEIEDNASVQLKLYRLTNDRFLIVSGFPTEEELREFIISLSKIEITVLRPSDYDENNETNKKKDNDAQGDEENQKNDDDFINPNATGGGGYTQNADNNSGNWYDDDEDEHEENNNGPGDKKIVHLASQSTLKKIKGRSRKVSSFNKQTADESLQMGLRIAASYGPFCTLSHVMSIDQLLKENDKKGYIERDDDKYEIVELKDVPTNKTIKTFSI